MSVLKAYAKRFASPSEQKRINAKANKILGKQMSVVDKKAAQYGARHE